MEAPPLKNDQLLDLKAKRALWQIYGQINWTISEIASPKLVAKSDILGNIAKLTTNRAPLRENIPNVEKIRRNRGDGKGRGEREID